MAQSAAKRARQVGTGAEEREARLARARAFSVDAARLLADRRCRDVNVLEVAGISPVTDFFVLATATSGRQMRTLARDMEELAPEHDLRPLGRGHRGETNERWIAIDLVDVVVHIFSAEARLFYDLDHLWGDAKQVPWAREGTAKGEAEGT